MLKSLLTASYLEKLMTDVSAIPTDAPVGAAALMRAAYELGVETVRRYHRLELSTPDGPIDEPVLFVANHGFGGVFDLNVFAAYAAFSDLALDAGVPSFPSSPRAPASRCSSSPTGNASRGHCGWTRCCG